MTEPIKWNDPAIGQRTLLVQDWKTGSQRYATPSDLRAAGWCPVAERDAAVAVVEAARRQHRAERACSTATAPAWDAQREYIHACVATQNAVGELDSAAVGSKEPHVQAHTETDSSDDAEAGPGIGAPAQAHAAAVPPHAESQDSAAQVAPPGGVEKTGRSTREHFAAIVDHAERLVGSVQLAQRDRDIAIARLTRERDEARREGAEAMLAHVRKFGLDATPTEEVIGFALARAREGREE